MFIQYEIYLGNKTEKIFWGKHRKNKLFYSVADIFNIDFTAVNKEFNEYVMDIQQFNLMPQRLCELLEKLKHFGLYIDYTEILTEIINSIKLDIKIGINSYYENHGYERFDCCELHNMSEKDIYALSHYIETYSSNVDVFFDEMFGSISKEAGEILLEYLSEGSYYPETLRQLQIILKYIDKMQKNKKLQTPDVFLLFANNHLNVSIKTFYNGLYLYNGTTDSPESEFIEGFVDNLTHMDIQDYGILKTGNIIEFVCSSIYFILKQGMTIKRCENCGKYFIPYERTDTKYCERISQQNDEMTCKEYGSQRLWYTNSSESYKLYRKVYSRKQMNARRNPDIAEYQKEFEQYKQQSNKFKKDVKKGIKTEQEFIEWLNKQ